MVSVGVLFRGHPSRLTFDNFLCVELGLPDAVTPDLHVAGTPDLQNSGSSFTKLSEYTLSLPSQAGQTLVMPGKF